MTIVDFRLVSNYKPQGDQGRAIEALTRGIYDREQHQVLLGVTGSGKTYTMAKVIEAANRPALVMAHNKTLAAQLYHEFKSFFPQNAVEYFVSYYDFYQPEAYVPAADLYVEKESTINDELDKLRLSATRSLFAAERRDCLIVASVSCIYGLGSPEAYYGNVARYHPPRFDTQTIDEPIARTTCSWKVESGAPLTWKWATPCSLSKTASTSLTRSGR